MPFLWPPGMQQTPAPWSPNWPEKPAWSRSSTPTRPVDECGDTPSGFPVRRTPPPHTEGLTHTQKVEVWPLTSVQHTSLLTEVTHNAHTHRPECRLPAGWWCSCVYRSSSSFPFQRSGQTGPSPWRPLHNNKFTWRQLHAKATCVSLELLYIEHYSKRKRLKVTKYHLKNK